MEPSDYNHIQYVHDSHAALLYTSLLPRHIYTGEFFIPREKHLFVLILYGIRSNIIHHVHL